MFFGTPDTFARKHIRSEAVFVCWLIVCLFVGLSVIQSNPLVISGVSKKGTTVPKKRFICPKKDIGMLFGTPDTFAKKNIRFMAASVHWFIVCPFVGLPVIQTNPPDMRGVPKNDPMSLETPDTFTRNI